MHINEDLFGQPTLQPCQSSFTSYENFTLSRVDAGLLGIANVLSWNFVPGDLHHPTKLPDDSDVHACCILILSLGSLSTGKQCLYNAYVAMWHTFSFLSIMAAYWKDHEFRELLSICEKEEIRRQTSGTARDRYLWQYCQPA